MKHILKQEDKPFQEKLPATDILFVGDMCPLDNYSWDVFAIELELQNFLNRSKNVAVNLECPLTESEVQLEKSGPHLKAKPDSVSLLTSLNVNLCNLANNHILDYLAEGITDTLHVLNKHKIRSFGITVENCNHETAVLEMGGCLLGLLSFAENEFSTSKDSACRAVGLDYAKQFEQLRALTEQVDFVIVQYHGGVEYYPYPTPRQQKYCRFLIDLGADMVICHHSHCISGHECYKGKPIYYGLGNFIFPEAGNTESWYRGLGIAVRVKDKLTPQVVGLRFDMYQHTIGFDNDVLNEFELLSQNLAEAGFINRAWEDYLTKREMNTLCSMFKPNLIERLMMKYLNQKKIIYRKLSPGTYNLLRCESHYERVLSTIELNMRRREQ